MLGTADPRGWGRTRICRVSVRVLPAPSATLTRTFTATGLPARRARRIAARALAGSVSRTLALVPAAIAVVTAFSLYVLALARPKLGLPSRNVAPSAK